MLLNTTEQQSHMTVDAKLQSRRSKSRLGWAAVSSGSHCFCPSRVSLIQPHLPSQPSCLRLEYQGTGEESEEQTQKYDQTFVSGTYQIIKYLSK